jgi:hypothetical protein
MINLIRELFFSRVEEEYFWGGKVKKSILLQNPIDRLYRESIKFALMKQVKIYSIGVLNG